MRNKVLLADDYEGILRLLSMQTRESFPEYAVETFPDGSSLNERLKKDVGGVRLIVTDNDMPGMNGIEIIRQYARNPRFSQIPFVLFSGDLTSAGEEAIEGGAYCCVQKPDLEGKYLEVLHEILDVRR